MGASRPTNTCIVPGEDVDKVNIFKQTTTVYLVLAFFKGFFSTDGIIDILCISVLPFHGELVNKLFVSSDGFLPSYAIIPF